MLDLKLGKFSNPLSAVVDLERGCLVAVELLALNGQAEAFPPRSFTSVDSLDLTVCETVIERLGIKSKGKDKLKIMQ